MMQRDDGENGAKGAGGPRRGRRWGNGPVTPEIVGAFLREYAELMPNSRHLRDRLAYRIVEHLANELALERIGKAGQAGGEATKWRRAVGKA